MADGAPLDRTPRTDALPDERVPVGRRRVVPRPRRAPRIVPRLPRALRWPDGVRCPRCESADTARLEARKKFYCRSCRYHFSVTSGTLFHNSHLPAWKWFLTISLMIQSEDGLPANQLVELLGVTYKTAWFAEHRVRAALQGGRDSPPPTPPSHPPSSPPSRARRRGAARAPVSSRGRSSGAISSSSSSTCRPTWPRCSGAPRAARTPTRSATRCSACSAAIRSRTPSSSGPGDGARRRSAPERAALGRQSAASYRAPPRS